MTWVYALGALLGVGAFLGLPLRLKYRITQRHLEIRLFGLPVRRIRLGDIDRVTKRHVRWAEHWWNTWRPFRRRLMIQRRRGIFKNIVITPKYRYEFRAELERAIQHAKVPVVGETPLPRLRSFTGQESHQH